MQYLIILNKTLIDGNDKTPARPEIFSTVLNYIEAKKLENVTFIEHPFGTNSILTYASDYYLKDALTVLHSAVARKINLDPNTFILLAPGTPTKVSVNNVMLGLGYVLAHSLEHISSKNPVTADVSGFREAYWGRLGYSNGNILSDYLFLNILNNIILKEDKRPLNAVIGVHERVPGVITAYQQIQNLFTLNSEGVNVSWFPGPTSNWYGAPTNLDALKKYPKLGNLDTIAKGLLLPRKEVDLLVGSALCNTTSNWEDSFYFNATSIVYEATSQFISKRALLKGAGVAVGALAEPASKGVPVTDTFVRYLTKGQTVCEAAINASSGYIDGQVRNHFLLDTWGDPLRKWPPLPVQLF